MHFKITSHEFLFHEFVNVEHVTRVYENYILYQFRSVYCAQTTLHNANNIECRLITIGLYTLAIATCF